jgi:adenylosuccinate lyase
MLVRFRSLMEGLVVRPERMRENIERGLGLWASGRVLSALVETGGLEREAAYAVVQRAALRASDERRPFRELIEADADVTGALPAATLAACFDEGHLLRHVPGVIARLDRLAMEVPVGH